MPILKIKGGNFFCNFHSVVAGSLPGRDLIIRLSDRSTCMAEVSNQNCSINSNCRKILKISVKKKKKRTAELLDLFSRMTCTTKSESRLLKHPCLAHCNSTWPRKTLRVKNMCTKEMLMVVKIRTAPSTYTFVTIHMNNTCLKKNTTRLRKKSISPPHL